MLEYRPFRRTLDRLAVRITPRHPERNAVLAGRFPAAVKRHGDAPERVAMRVGGDIARAWHAAIGAPAPALAHARTSTSE